MIRLHEIISKLYTIVIIITQSNIEHLSNDRKYRI